MFCANAPAAKTIAAAANRKPFENEPLAQACAVTLMLCNAAIRGSLLLLFLPTLFPIFGLLVCDALNRTIKCYILTLKILTETQFFSIFK
jgi:hypothetical protein